MKKVSEYSTLFKNIGSEWKWLLKIMSRYKLEIIGYTIMGVVGIAMGFGASIASKYLIDAVVNHSNETIVTAAAEVFIAGGVAANTEKMIHASTIMAPSKQTAA